MPFFVRLNGYFVSGHWFSALNKELCLLVSNFHKFASVESKSNVYPSSPMQNTNRTEHRSKLKDL